MRKFSLNQNRVFARTDWPEMKVKGKQSSVVSEFLLYIHRNEVRVESEHVKMRVLSLWGFCGFYNICTNKRRWLSNDEKRRLLEIEQALLQGYHWLSAHAFFDLEAMFAMKPKFHAISEIIKFSVDFGLNPGQYWSFGCEDTLGRLGRIAARVHPSTMDLRVLERWVLSFFFRISQLLGVNPM